MPWCPQCKTEYRDGILNCTDCGTKLINEQPEESEYTLLCTLENDVIAEKLKKYFDYSGIESYYEYDEKELGYSVYVKEDELKKAKKSFQAFYSVELEALSKVEEKDQGSMAYNSDDAKSYDHDSSMDMNENYDSEENDYDEYGFETEDSEDTDLNAENYKESFMEPSGHAKDTSSIQSEEQRTKIAKMLYEGGSYEKKADKAKDLKSTTYTFFFFGFIGVAFVLLNLFGVINFIGGPLQYLLMSAMFIGFIFVGVNAMQRAKKVLKEAIQEEKTTKAIMEYLDLSVTNEVMEGLKDSSFSEEGNFIRVMEGLKAIVVSQFGELDDAYLDYVTEEFYNSRFEEDLEDDEE